LGLDNTLFETDKLFFSVFDKEFGLGGFNMIAGQSFTLGIGAGPTAVPEPGSLWLLAAGLLTLLLRSSRSGRRIADSA
jgi:hypothetical protein